jgi:hypothetical protein
MNWHDLFSYEDGKLFWKVTRNPLKDFVGKQAGSSDGKGYIYVCVNSKKKAAHRVIW